MNAKYKQNFIDFSIFSDPPELLLGMDGSSIGLKARKLPDARPSRAAAVEQWARQSSGHAPRLSTGALSSSIQRRGSDSLGMISHKKSLITIFGPMALQG